MISRWIPATSPGGATAYAVAALCHVGGVPSAHLVGQAGGGGGAAARPSSSPTGFEQLGSGG